MVVLVLNRISSTVSRGRRKKKLRGAASRRRTDGPAGRPAAARPLRWVNNSPRRSLGRDHGSCGAPIAGGRPQKVPGTSSRSKLPPVAARCVAAAAAAALVFAHSAATIFALDNVGLSTIAFNSKMETGHARYYFYTPLLPE